MKLTQISQHAEDLDRAEAFYSSLLGAPATGRFDPPGLLFFALGETRLLLSSTAPSVILYLETPRLRERVEELRAAGITVEGEPHVIFSHEDDRLGSPGTDEWQAFIRDSEGNLVGLVEQVPSAS